MVLLVDHHLWWQVVQGSAKGLAPRTRRMNCPAKVGNLQGIFQANENVLWLDISMNDVLGVAVLDGLSKAKDIAFEPERVIEGNSFGLHHLLEIPC